MAAELILTLSGIVAILAWSLLRLRRLRERDARRLYRRQRAVRAFWREHAETRFEHGTPYWLRRN